MIAHFGDVWGVEERYWKDDSNQVNNVDQTRDFDGAFLVHVGHNIYHILLAVIDEVKTENGEVKAIYDLQGRKLTEVTKPGFYIVDGEKVFVK